LVLVLIVALWGIFLGPSIIRRVVDRRSGDSIGSFHRQLGVLRRTGPTLVPAAHRLATPEPRKPVAVSSSGLPVVSSRPSLVVVRSEPAATALAGEATRSSEDAGDDPRTGGRERTRRSDAYFRPEACKRRRDVLSVLAGLVVVTAFIGVIPGARPALMVTVLALVVLGAYVALLVRMRNVAEERQTKLRYLPTPVVEQPVVLRRTAAR
jgi:hypothetical protein